MKSIERFADLMRRSTVEDWRNQVFKLGSGLGYERTLLAIFPDRYTPVEAEFAFLHSNYSAEWLDRYHAQKLGHVDPVAAHCGRKSIPLIWSPDIFSARKQKEMYEEACGYGLRSGVTLPIHGAQGEMGILCFVNDMKPDKRFQRDTHHNLPELSCFRDFIFESSLQFMQPSCTTEKPAPLTLRELECLKWSAAGKSSWEIGQILHCTEATANYHFSSLRRKFNTTTRQQAVIRAINLGLIHPM